MDSDNSKENRIQFETEYKTELELILNKYDKGMISIACCAEENMDLAKRIARKLNDDEDDIYFTEMYEKLKWVGWTKIEKLYKRDENKYNDDEKLDFHAIEFIYITENDLHFFP